MQRNLHCTSIKPSWRNHCWTCNSHRRATGKR